MLGQHLDGDGAVQAGVAGLVDLAHTPGAEGGLDLVRAEGGAGIEWHVLLSRRDKALEFLGPVDDHRHPVLVVVVTRSGEHDETLTVGSDVIVGNPNSANHHAEHPSAK